MAKQHEVVATRFGAKVGIKGKKSVDTIRCRSQVFSDNFGGFKGDPAEMFVDLLERAEDQLLRLLKILGFEVRHDFADNRKVDLLAGR